MTLIELAQKLRPLIEKAVMSLNDEDAIEATTLFPHWIPEDAGYFVDDKVQYEGILYRCLQNHTSQQNWNPVSAPSLWAKVLIPDENVIPEWEQPDSTNPYMQGDKVSFQGHIYESAINNNIWSPSAYPAGWTLIE